MSSVRYFNRLQDPTHAQKWQIMCRVGKECQRVKLRYFFQDSELHQTETFSRLTFLGKIRFMYLEHSENWKQQQQQLSYDFNCTICYSSGSQVGQGGHAPIPPPRPLQLTSPGKINHKQWMQKAATCRIDLHPTPSHPPLGRWIRYYVSVILELFHHEGNTKLCG